MARRYDPDRRQRIADAAVRVVRRSGIAGLSHRAVAAEADVPLGSTTYHFKNLDDLLLAALSQVNDGWLARFTAWLDGLDPARPLAEEIARLVEESLALERSRVELEYELYFAGLRREAVRPMAARCLEDMVTLLRRRLPEEDTARAVVGLLDGLMLQFLLTGMPFDREQTRVLFARLVPEAETGSRSPESAG